MAVQDSKAHDSKSKEDELNDKIMQLVLQNIDKAPDLESQRQEYLKNNPIQTYVEPKGIQSIPDETVSGYQKNGILGGLGGLAKGAVDYLNTPEGSKLAAIIDPDYTSKQILQARADSIQSDDDLNRTNIAQNNKNIQENLDKIFENYSKATNDRNKAFLDFGLNFNKDKMIEALKNKGAINLEGKKEDFEANQKALDRALQIQLESDKNAAKQGDKAAQGRLKFVDDIEKDPTFKSISGQLNQLEQIKGLMKNPNSLDMKLFPIMARKAAGDSGNVAVAEQKGMTDYGDFMTRFANSASNWKTGKLTKSQIAVIQDFVNKQESVLNQRKSDILDQKTNTYSKVYDVDPSEFEVIRSTYDNGKTPSKSVQKEPIATKSNNNDKKIDGVATKNKNGRWILTK